MRRMTIAAAAGLIALGASARAQEWPARPVTLIVPFAAGGGVDVSARVQAQRMGELLGQSMVVENVGAAAGMAGGARVAEGRARRLYAPHRQQRHARLQPEPLQETALQRGDGFRAGRVRDRIAAAS